MKMLRFSISYVYTNCNAKYYYSVYNSVDKTIQLRYCN